MKRTLKIENLHATIEGKEILKGVDLALSTGEVHALMGPNGSGKSTLSNVIFGHPAYEITDGRILLDDEDITKISTAERARRGLFLAFQYPVEIPGVTVTRFLKRAVEARNEHRGEAFNASQFIRDLKEHTRFLEMDWQFVNRYLNEGFSGGEKKRMEILQMLMLQPAFAIMDETDSGLDIDALKVVSKGVNQLQGDHFSALVITHYQRILDYIKPDKIHILLDGQIVRTGGFELAAELEKKGYDWIRKTNGLSETTTMTSPE